MGWVGGVGGCVCVWGGEKMGERGRGCGYFLHHVLVFSEFADLGNFSTRPVTFREGLNVFPAPDIAMMSSWLQTCASVELVQLQLACGWPRDLRSSLATRPCHYDSHALPLLGPPEGIGPFPSDKGMTCACDAGRPMERCAFAGSHHLRHASRPGEQWPQR